MYVVGVLARVCVCVGGGGDCKRVVKSRQGAPPDGAAAAAARSPPLRGTVVMLGRSGCFISSCLSAWCVWRMTLEFWHAFYAGKGGAGWRSARRLHAVHRVPGGSEACLALVPTDTVSSHYPILVACLTERSYAACWLQALAAGPCIASLFVCGHSPVQKPRATKNTSSI